MKSLHTGESPVLTLRVPRPVMQKIRQLAGSDRGSRALWHRAVIERAIREGVTLADLTATKSESEGSR